MAAKARRVARFAAKLEELPSPKNGAVAYKQHRDKSQVITLIILIRAVTWENVVLPIMTRSFLFIRLISKGAAMNKLDRENAYDNLLAFIEDAPDVPFILGDATPESDRHLLAQRFESSSLTYLWPQEGVGQACIPAAATFTGAVCDYCDEPLDGPGILLTVEDGSLCPLHPACALESCATAENLIEALSAEPDETARRILESFEGFRVG